jgi:hypothetical protein
MAVRDEATATGADAQGDLKRRNVGQTQANGNYIPQEVAPKLDEKTKEKVCFTRVECREEEDLLEAGKQDMANIYCLDRPTRSSKCWTITSSSSHR